MSKRALMLLVIAFGTFASQVSVATPGDSENSAQSTSAENAAAREQIPPTAPGDTAPAAASTASSKSPSTDAPKDTATTSRPPVAAPRAAKEQEEFKIPPSYKARMRGDETVYCRKEGESGTRFQKTSCYTLAELKYKVEAEKAAADDITRRARVCSSAGVCSNN